jgi:sodium/hydrogen exchanger-like protein 6/7/sodium/hydrogen exchanger 8
MGMFEVLSVCALLCSSDVIAAISMINYADQPKLFSIVYGEGVFNDIVSIILFNTVQGFKTNFNFTVKSPFEILGNFLALAATSIGIGLFFGIFSSLTFKWFRFLTHSAITETLLLIIIAFVSYFLS